MEWIQRLNQAVAYIEDNLTGEIEIEKAARIAACSTFHFQRMFTYIAGVTLGEYIRRRKMTAAAFELLNSDAKIIDIAGKYGYESPTSFNRAFQNIHGVAPSAAKKSGVPLTAYPRITFTLSIKGEESMNYKIEKFEPIRTVGVGLKGPLTMEECFQKVPEFWQQVQAKGIFPRLCELVDGTEPAGILGVSDCADGNFAAYYICVATNKPCPPDMEEFFIPTSNWAIFDCIGAMPDAMQTLQKRIVSEWLPTSGYEYGPGPDIEVYFEEDQFTSNYKSQAWLPIVKAKD